MRTSGFFCQCEVYELLSWFLPVLEVMMWQETYVVCLVKQVKQLTSRPACEGLQVINQG